MRNLQVREAFPDHYTAVHFIKHMFSLLYADAFFKLGVNTLRDDRAAADMPRINTEYREEAKRKIITAALEVATSDGWQRVTLETIARKVGVTKRPSIHIFQAALF